MREPTAGNFKIVDIRDHVSADLGALTVNAFASPLRHVCVERRPDELFADHLTCSLDSWVSKAMDGLKDTPTPGEWYEGTCRTIVDINVKVVRTDRKFPEG